MQEFIPELDVLLAVSAQVVEILGMLVIMTGALVTTWEFMFKLRKSGGPSFHDFRSKLGQYILLGLEFLVAADIVGTISVDPTFESLGVLALLILIRTFLSFTLEVEINGHWPWKGSEINRQMRT